MHGSVCVPVCTCQCVFTFSCFCTASSPAARSETTPLRVHIISRSQDRRRLQTASHSLLLRLAHPHSSHRWTLLKQSKGYKAEMRSYRCFFVFAERQAFGTQGEARDGTMKEPEIQTSAKNSSVKLSVVLYQRVKLPAGSLLIKWSAFRCRCHSVALHDTRRLSAKFWTLSRQDYTAAWIFIFFFFSFLSPTFSSGSC